MKTQYYIRIEGDETKLYALNKRFAGVLIGDVVERRSTGYPLVECRPYYWASKRLESTFENLSYDLASLLQSIVDLRGPGSEVEITVVVAATCRKESERPGLYLAAEPIRLMGVMGASLDYDIVPHLGD